MSSIDIESLLQEVSPEQPCGEDLEYDTRFQDMERAAQGKAETQFSEAEPPNWRDVKDKSLQVLTETRDLRALGFLAQASLNTDGWPEFADCLKVLDTWLEKFWDHVHPQLDPDDGDPTFRVNSITKLAHQNRMGDEETVIDTVREKPLVESRMIGRFSLRDFEIVHGVITVNLPEGETAPTAEVINAAFMDVEIESIQETADALQSSADSVASIEAKLTEQLGASQAPDLSALVVELKNAHKYVAGKLAERGVGVEEEDAADEESGAGDGAAAARSGGGSGAGPSISGEVRNRKDVGQALEKICRYYSRYEPSSPVPILLRRALRLLDKDFMDIIKDIAPDAVGQVEVLSGSGGSGYDSGYNSASGYNSSSYDSSSYSNS